MEQFDWTPGSLMLLTKLKPSNMTLMTEQLSVRLVYGTLIQQRSVLPPRPRSPPGPRLKSPPGPNPPVQRSLSGETRWTTRSRRSRGTHWQTHSLILSMYNNSAPTERQALINIVEEVVRAWSQGSSVCWPPWLLPEFPRALLTVGGQHTWDVDPSERWCGDEWGWSDPRHWPRQQVHPSAGLEVLRGVQELVWGPEQGDGQGQATGADILTWALTVRGRQWWSEGW